MRVEGSALMIADVDAEREKERERVGRSRFRSKREQVNNVSKSLPEIRGRRATMAAKWDPLSSANPAQIRQSRPDHSLGYRHF
jgi:hypothetical protein